MNKKDIKFLEIRYLRGPNIWTYVPALEAIIDIGELEDFPSNTIPGFVDRIKSFLPSLIEHRCSYEERGGFLQRLDEGTWTGHILEHVSIELQNLAGIPGGFGKARETSIRGIYKVVFAAPHKEVSIACLHAGRELLLAAIEGQAFDVNTTVERIRALAEQKLLGPSTACIVEAATTKDRGIPAIRLLSTGNLVQLGYGSRSRRIWTAETDRTSAIAESISRDKDLTKSLLESCGIPIPKGRIVDSAEDAWIAAEEIGIPVVVKPYDGNRGRGVFTNLTAREDIEAAYTTALSEGNGVIVEQFIPGSEHRLLVVGGKLIAATRGEVASVIGDGKTSINELINQQLNTDPLRGESEVFPLALINLEHNTVSSREVMRQGFTPESIPPSGHKVLIARIGNMNSDITDLVHPSVAAIASLAARIVGLDIAGIDLVAEDISRPLEGQSGAIVEVNAGPSLLMHLKPAIGKPRPVGRAIVNHLFPNGEDGRIPVVGITGSYGKTTVSRLIARLLTLAGQYTGLACSDGLFLDRKLVDKNDNAHWEAANRILMNKSVDTAVLENGFETILTEGLAYDRCQVGVVTNIEPTKHYGRHYIETPKQVFNVLRTQVDIVLPKGIAVLNARESMLLEMAELCDGEVIFFSVDPNLPIITEHRVEGKRAVIVQQDQIFLVTGSNEVSLTKLSLVPLTNGEQTHFQVENILAAVSTAWALGISPDIMRIGIETFSTHLR